MNHPSMNTPNHCLTKVGHLNRILCGVLLLLLTLPAFAGFGGRKGPLELEKAKILRNVEQDSEQVRILIDSVSFSQQDIHINCDYAEFYSLKRKAYLRGKVVIVDSARVLCAEEVTYFEVSGVAQAVGNVVVKERNNRTIRCRRLDYDYDSGFATYRGEVVVTDSTGRTTITGDLATYDEVNREADVTINPKLVKLDSLKKNPITITGNRMWMNDSFRVAKTEGNVVIVQDTFRATGGYLLFNDSTGFATLTKSPKLLRGKEEMKADSMRFLFKNQQLDDMIAFKDVDAITPADSTPTAPLNHMTGQQLHSYFTKGVIDSIVVSGNAKSKYYIYEKGKNSGANVASGDTLRIVFQRKEIRKITVIGGIEGTYYPEGWNKPIE